MHDGVHYLVFLQKRQHNPRVSCRISAIPNNFGACEPSPMMANQFSIFISRDGGSKKYASVLSPGQHNGHGQFNRP
uniref:Uncharacterized protein n=1 Tax=Helianthus annuus TaxID=4232 RepID=A0A251VPN2_HELAN